MTPTEQTIIEATKRYQETLRALQPEIKIDISISEVRPVPNRGATYCLFEDSAYKITVYDKDYLPF